MKTLAKLREDREQLIAGMILELQANQITLGELRTQYGMFIFLGGDVPTGTYGLSAITSYLERPFVADRILIGEIERYRQLASAELGLDPVVSGPRSLRCRKDLGDALNRTAVEIQTLGNKLESALAKLLKEMRRAPRPRSDELKC